MILQGRVIKEFLYLHTGGTEHKKTEKEEEKGGGEKGKQGQEEWRKEGKVSTSLDLPGKC